MPKDGDGRQARHGETALETFDTGPNGIRVKSALTVASADAVEWDHECDVLVVGCGLAGASAALRAAEHSDTSVIVIDRFDGGGASQQSGGVLYLGGGTSVQCDVGVTDTVEAMADYLAIETGNVVSRDTLERFCRDSASIIPWLARYGVRFGGPVTEEKTSYPSEEYLYYSGNERLQDSLEVAPPAPRGHRAKPRAGAKASHLSGADLMIPLKEALDRAANIDFLRRTGASRLIRDGSGCVIGIEAQRIASDSLAAVSHKRLMQANGNMTMAMLGISKPMLRAAIAVERSRARPVRIRARRGVILASGGFVHNARMLAEEAPVYRHVAPLGTVGDDGSGIMLGHSVGGATGQMEMVSAWRFLYPPAGWVKGVLVAADGRRIVNEEAYGARTGKAMFEAADGLGWLILDRPKLDVVRREARSNQLLGFQKMTINAALRFYAKTAPTLAELAGKAGLPPEALEATIAEYNADIVAGRPDRLGKSPKLCSALDQGPFTAIDLSYRTKFHPLPGITVGGLKVDETTGHVVGADGRPINGLFAAGRTAVGLPSNLYVSGLSLADCVWSGWRAADTAGSG